MNMKRIVAILGVIALAAIAVSTMANAGADSSKKHHQATVTVISTDPTAKTMTFKDDKGMEKTAPVLDSALGTLKSVKPGDKVILTCEDNDKGEHEGISEIKPTKS